MVPRYALIHMSEALMSGDILASGLLWLVHARHKTSAVGRISRDSIPAAAEYDYWHEAARPRFWEEILEQRAALLDDIAMRLKMMSPHNLSPLPSVMAAQQRCRELSPEEFVIFTEKWLARLAAWRDRRPVLCPAGSVR